ncbi:disintegrin and metalloproteinase domain-containing protein 1a-like, partial [Saccopteryx bilineata]|uniref:disintegrin and metalloproteinase domain-containing protein 1a-like n=1 Tax=Saccopteryx bilineata TaxID=59482 RepID=UPI00338D45C2
MNETSRVLQTWAPQMKDLRLGLVPGSSCIRLGTVLVLVLSLLPSLYCDLGSVYYSSYEIVIPKALTVEGREDPGEKASYVILMQGQKQLIRLQVKRDYFVHNFPVFSYHKGILGQEMPVISHDCHYEGYIEGVLGSFVSVNACSGLRGILIKEGKAYGIEPMDSSKRFEHVLYTVSHQARVSCSVTSKDSQEVSSSRPQGTARLPAGLQALSYLWSHTKYVEMFVVVNNLQFQMWGGDVSETVQRVLDVIALANSFTRGINTEVVLAGMEIWTEEDLVEVPADLQVTLGNFNSWRQEQLHHRVKHDVAHMIVGQRPEQGMGHAFLDGACSSGFAAAVESLHHQDLLLSAALMAHELGHNLGIQHDHSACICKEKHFCLMYENITKESGFSNCSSDYFYQFLQEHKGACLFNKPQRKGRLRRADVCGNGVMEGDEQCDCGNLCRNNPCCDQSCRLKDKAQCSPGPCCNLSCQFLPEGTNCRPAQGVCDLPEYCSGTSGECPANTYMQDGTPCGLDFCVDGECRSQSVHCQHLFGPFAMAAPMQCYIINEAGNRFGHCGPPTSSNPNYIKCNDENKFCGKIMCTGVEELPEIKPFQTLIQIPHDQDFCWSMDAYNTNDISDDGDINFGTSCGPNKVCMNYSCTDSAVFNYDCIPKDTCSGRGVCNNLKHCHCEAGYAPPKCDTEGNGGSEDSGPPGNSRQEPEGSGSHTTIKPMKHEKKLDNMIISFFILFIILLAVLIISMCVICRSPEEPTKEGPEGAAEKPPEEKTEKKEEEREEEKKEEKKEEKEEEKKEEKEEEKKEEKKEEKE